MRKFATRNIQLFSKSNVRIPRYVVALIVILVIALDLRVESVMLSVVDTPIRADALEYFLYGHNLKNHGVYSRADTLVSGAEIPPKPDAMRTPLYSLFVMPFFGDLPTLQELTTIATIQAIVSTITVLLVFLTARLFMPIAFAVAVAALTAISPHLVTMNIYLLSETLFCFLLVAAMFVVATMMRDKNAHKSIALPAVAGLMLGAAALTHPMLLYFMLPLAIYLFYRHGWKKSRQLLAVLVLGFSVVYGPWIVRNIVTLGTAGDNTLMLAALRTGVYRDLMFQGDPKTLGYPYRSDPGYEATSKTFGAVVTEVGRSFSEAPLDQLRWYLVGKPLMLWSWDSVAGAGDVFVYPVTSTPYRYLPHFQATHALMHFTHWGFVVLMIGGIVIAWLPNKQSRLPDHAIPVARIVSLLLLYHLAVMIAGFPLPRYSVPMRPFMYMMSMLPLILLAQWARLRFASRRRTR